MAVVVEFSDIPEMFDRITSKFTTLIEKMYENIS
jgi:hypothetical protein